MAKLYKQDWGASLLAGAAIVLFAVGLYLGLIWLIWLLWTAVLPQFWPEGPKSFIDPGYWLFAGMWTLLGFIGNLFYMARKS